MSKAKPKTYYAWKDGKPCGLNIVFKGGNLRRRPPEPTVLITFGEGRYTTDDPEKIAFLDQKMAEPGSGITDSEAEFLKHTRPELYSAEKEVERLEAELAKLRAETSELRGKK